MKVPPFNRFDTGLDWRGPEWRKLFGVKISIFIRSNGPMFGSVGLVDQLLELQDLDHQAAEMIGWAAVLGRFSRESERQHHNGGTRGIHYDIGPTHVRSDEQLRFHPRPEDIPVMRCLGRFGVLHHSCFHEFLREREIYPTRRELRTLRPWR